VSQATPQAAPPCACAKAIREEMKARRIGVLERLIFQLSCWVARRRSTIEELVSAGLSSAQKINWSLIHRASGLGMSLYAKSHSASAELLVIKAAHDLVQPPHKAREVCAPCTRFWCWMCVLTRLAALFQLVVAKSVFVRGFCEGFVWQTRLSEPHNCHPNG
jgi:hypothetical protein